MIHCKKKDLLYEDITCLCHSLAQLWVLCLVVLFLLVLRLAPVCGPSSLWFCSCWHLVYLLYMWVLFFEFLFLLGLGFAPSSVLGVFSVLF